MYPFQIGIVEIFPNLVVNKTFLSFSSSHFRFCTVAVVISLYLVLFIGGGFGTEAIENETF
jgi:hypothetical protein